MSIIGVNGKIGSGKDTVGKIIQYLTSEYRDKYNFIEWQDRVENYGSSTHSKFEVKKFAGKLKEIAFLLTGKPVENFEEQNFKKLNMGSAWNMTYREFLQKLGTEAMRNGLHEDVWVNALFADYKAKWVPTGDSVAEEDVSLEKEYPNWIITDMRFPNELESVVERQGITIRVVRPVESYPENPNFNGDMQIAVKMAHSHPSETALDDAKFHYEIINDGTIEDLVEKVKQILITEKII
jgi:hypothetical protein